MCTNAEVELKGPTHADKCSRLLLHAEEEEEEQRSQL